MILNNLCSFDKSDYEKIFNKVDHDNVINNVNVNLRFKFIKFDPNGNPKIDLLIDTLFDYFTHYCFDSEKRGLNRVVTEKERNNINREARKLFRKWQQDEITDENKPTSGEMREMILWLLMEAVLDAPQVVAKMSLKTNPKLETFGSDGIHIKTINNILNIFFGEAKLYRSISKALDSIFESIEGFHENEMWKHEYRMVTNHYKHLSDKEKNDVYNFISGKIEAHELKINHACLVGYDWNKYKKLDTEERSSFVDNFMEIYKKDTERLTKLIQSRFDNFSKKEFGFEVFFLPFKNVQELRDKFNKEL
ncbi:DUF1837 domain-containing protein [Francisella philomiragia]|nr:DUF1837 domain-containing protein [Francisella philomiragia]MBK2307151.1 DUF1837 domain-containing protein [Francisella philomiragia]